MRVPRGGTRAGTSTITVTYDDGVRAGDLLTLPELQHLRARSARRGRAADWHREAAAIVRDHLVAGRWLHSLEPVLFALLVGTLVYGSLVYQLARLGYFHRLRLHRPASPADLDALLSPAARPSLTVLVPAYKEDPRVVRKTLL